MEQNESMRKKGSHVTIITSDGKGAESGKAVINGKLFWFSLLLISAILGAFIGYFFNQDKVNVFVKRKVDAQQALIEQLQESRDLLEAENQELKKRVTDLIHQVENLDAQIAVLGNTVYQKMESENEFLAQQESEKVPTEYPLTGSASMESGENICIFTASSGATVVATASGTVTAINDDSEYGHNVWIDHGNGYITVYRNAGSAIVRPGDTVTRGTALFVIGSNNRKFAYQIMKDGSYIDPMELLSING